MHASVNKPQIAQPGLGHSGPARPSSPRTWRPLSLTHTHTHGQANTTQNESINRSMIHSLLLSLALSLSLYHSFNSQMWGCLPANRCMPIFLCIQVLSANINKTLPASCPQTRADEKLAIFLFSEIDRCLSFCD
jgi:hypothetical protein